MTTQTLNSIMSWVGLLYRVPRDGTLGLAAVIYRLPHALLCGLLLTLRGLIASVDSEAWQRYWDEFGPDAAAGEQDEPPQ